MESAFLAVVDHSVAFLRPLLPEVATKIVADVLGEFLERAFGLGGDRRRKAEFVRLRDTVDTLCADIRTLQQERRWDADAAEREASDPGFGDYVNEVFSASADTRDESKRRIFGRYIAARLQVASDAEVITLRRALRTTRDLTETQLLALAAVVLFYDLGSPDKPFADYAEAEAWLTRRYGTALATLAPMPWTETDLETLASIGTVLSPLRPGQSFFEGGGTAPELNQWLEQNGLEQRMIVNDGQPASRAQIASIEAAEPTRTNLARLGAGRALGDNAPVNFRTADLTRLDVIRPTPLGVAIGKVVLEHLCAPSAAMP